MQKQAPPFRAERAMNGTWGEVWIDSDYLAEIIGIKAVLKLKTESISQSRQLTDGTKVVGIEATGELKLHKISSRFLLLLSENMKQGKQTEFTIITKINDPDSGCERIKLIGCVFNELTIADWEHKKMSEEKMPFTFRDWLILDHVDS